MKSKVNQKSFLSVLIAVLILLSMNLAGCKKDDSISDTSITDNLPNISGYPVLDARPWRRAAAAIKVRSKMAELTKEKRKALSLVKPVLKGRIKAAVQKKYPFIKIGE